MKLKIIIMILLFVSPLFLLGIYLSSNEKPNNKKLQQKGSRTNNKMTDEYLLKNKFDEKFDQTPALLTIRLRNIDTNDQMDIVCTNVEWRYHCINSLKLAKNKTDYADYMLENTDKLFEVSSKLYSALMKFKAGDTYTSKYKTKEEFLKGLESAEIKNLDKEELLQNRALLKLFLNFTPIVRLDPKGSIFFGDIEFENKGESYMPNPAPISKVTEKTLKERFSDFSTSPIFVLIRIRNVQTKEEAEITCENEVWARICADNLKLVKPNNYTNYMVKNHNKVFEVDSATYERLKKSTNPSFINSLKRNVIIRRNCLDGSIMINER